MVVFVLIYVSNSVYSVLKYYKSDNREMYKENSNMNGSEVHLSVDYLVLLLEWDSSRLFLGAETIL